MNVINKDTEVMFVVLLKRFKIIGLEQDRF